MKISLNFTHCTLYFSVTLSNIAQLQTGTSAFDLCLFKRALILSLRSVHVIHQNHHSLIQKGDISMMHGAHWEI